MTRNQRERTNVERGRVVRQSLREDGFTLVEFMISSLIMATVLGSAVGLATQVQSAYSQQYDGNTAEQEARYALDWIARDLRSAGSDPYGVIVPAQEVWIDPNAGADDDDSIRVEADAFPNGPDGDNADSGEIIIITRDPATNTITRQDLNGGIAAGVVPMTEPIFTDLSFTWLDTAGNETAVPALVAFVRVTVTAQASVRTGFSAERTTTLSTDVRLRTR